MEKQKLRIVKIILYNKRTSGGITIPDFKLYYRATVLKTAWYWHKNREEDQWNRIEDLGINPHTFKCQIFDKEAKNTKWKKESIFNKWCWHNWISTCGRIKTDPYLSICTKLKSKSKTLNQALKFCCFCPIMCVLIQPYPEPLVVCVTAAPVVGPWVSSSQTCYTLLSLWIF